MITYYDAEYMRSACRISRARTPAHLECLIFIAFTKQKWLCESASTFISSLPALLCCVWIAGQRQTISIYSLNLFVFITQTECFYCSVRSVTLNKIPVNLNF